VTALGIARRNDKLDYGRVVREAVGLIRRRAPALLLISLILVVLPGAVFSAVRISMLHDFTGLQTLTNPTSWVVTGLFFLVSMISQAALLHLAVSDISGHPVPTVDSFRVGLRVFLPLLLITILVVLGWIVGAILLVVPGVILMLMWCVAAPAYVNEKIGLFEVFGRSATLTKGNRWRILGLGLLFLIATWIVELPLRAVLGVGLMRADPNFVPPLTTALILGALYSIILTPVTYAFWASLYVQLKRGHDGLGGEDVAEVFD